MGKPEVNYKDCMACGICTTACPFSCLSLKKNDVDRYKKAYPQLDAEDRCTGCGICEKSCPVAAIKIVTRTRE